MTLRALHVKTQLKVDRGVGRLQEPPHGPWDLKTLIRIKMMVMLLMMSMMMMSSLIEGAVILEEKQQLGLELCAICEHSHFALCAGVNCI